MSGPSCSKLNEIVSYFGVKISILKYGKYIDTFCCKNASSSHFFSKNTCKLDIVITRLVNILTTNELIKLHCFEQLGAGITPVSPYLAATHKKYLGKLLQMSIHNACHCGEIGKTFMIILSCANRYEQQRLSWVCASTVSSGSSLFINIVSMQWFCK